MTTFVRKIEIEVVYDDDNLTEEEMEQDVWDAVRSGLWNSSKCTDYEINLVDS